MKKLYVSVPVKGRTEEAIVASIRKMQKIAEVIFDKDLEVIESVWTEDLEKFDIAGLARHIDAMKDADYFVGVDNVFNTYCDFEASIVHRFNIPATFVNACEICPDMFDGKFPVAPKGSWDIR